MPPVLKKLIADNQHDPQVFMDLTHELHNLDTHILWSGGGYNHQTWLECHQMIHLYAYGITLN